MTQHLHVPGEDLRLKKKSVSFKHTENETASDPSAGFLHLDDHSNADHRSGGRQGDRNALKG